MKYVYWLIGIARLTVRGNQLPRFLRLCSQKSNILWNVEYLEWDCLRFCISAKNVFLLRDALKKTKCHIETIDKIGLPFLVRRYRYRFVFFASVTATFCMLFYLSGFVWQISITGNTSISDENICAYMQELHMGVGTRIQDVNTEKLETQLLKHYPNVIWNSISIQGTTMHISIKEQMENDRLENKLKAGYDLVSPVDGTVEKIYVRSGTAAVKVKDQVKKGDVLVYGWVPIYDESNTQIIQTNDTVSDADVYVRGKIEEKISLDYRYKKSQYTGRIRKYTTYAILGRSIDFVPIIYGKMRGTKLCNNQPLLLTKSFRFPLNKIRIYQREMQLVDARYSVQEMKKMQESSCGKLIQKLEEKGIQILDKNVIINNRDDGSEMDVILDCLFYANKRQVSNPPVPQNTRIDEYD